MTGPRSQGGRRRSACGRRAPKAGFTLVEVLIVCGGMMGLIVLLSLALADTGTKAWTRVDDQTLTNAEARRVMNRVVREVRGATQAAGLICDQANESLQFTLSTGEDITYARIAGNSTFTRIEDGGAPTLIAQGVTGFVPTCNTGIVTLELTVQLPVGSPRPGGPPTQTLTTQVRVRNP